MANSVEQIFYKIAQILGEVDATKLTSSHIENREITDDEIAHETGLQLSSVRKILFKLYDHSLVSLWRSRDANTEWYIFHWELQSDQLESFIINQKRRVLEKLRIRLDSENKHELYPCSRPPKCESIPFTGAIELVFKCPNCGKHMMHYEDQEKIIDALEKKIEQLRKELIG